MNALTHEYPLHLRRIAVRIDCDFRRRLRRFVQSRRIRGADLDPDLEGAGQITHRNRRLIGVRDPTRKHDPFRILEAIREDARREVFRRLRRMHRDAERQRFIAPAIHVRHGDVERVDR